MKILSRASLFLLCMFLIQFCIQIDKKSSLESSLFHLFMFLIQFLFKIGENPLWSSPSSSSAGFLFNSYSRFMKILSGALPPLPVQVSYSILIQIWWKSSLKPPSSIQFMFHIQCVFKSWLKSSLALSLLHQCVLLRHSSLILDRILFGVSLFLLCMFIISNSY